MSSKSRVLICVYISSSVLHISVADLYPYHLEEYILHTANREMKQVLQFNLHPSRCYGAGKIRPYNPNLDMMVLFNS